MDEEDERKGASGRTSRRVTVLAVAAACALLLPLFAAFGSRRESRPARAAATADMAGATATGANPVGRDDPAFAGASAQGATGNADYSRFTHTNPQHARLPCLLCHRREDATGARPKLPGHTPCAGCHAQQFRQTQPPHPVCAICHTRPPAADLKAFPRARTFDARFNHALHTRGAARPRDGCNACHRPARGGVALSIPVGLSAHATCYQCHGARAQSASGEDISSCGACHQLGRPSRPSVSARAYAVNFSHAEHTRRRLACAECHTVRAGAGRNQVTSPFPSQHRAPAGTRSCATCHNNRRAFGGDDFTDCKRCHEGSTWHY
jgi:c(7)-type cytochrome triheme protein